MSLTKVNGALVLQLSLFGLAMAVATLFWIPSNVEPLFWLAIFVTCAYLIARRCEGRYFLHGFLVSLANSVWVTAVHVLLFETYLARHPQEGAMPLSSRTMMLFAGPVIGVLSGIVLGVFALIAGRLVKAGGRHAVGNDPDA